MLQRLRLLLVEDSADDAVLLERELRRSGYDPVLRRVETAGDMAAALEDGAWDAILSDYTMPGFDGLEALGVARRFGGDAVFILVSGSIGEDRAVEAVKAGADDWVMKGNLARLVPSLQRALREREERLRRREAEQRLRASLREKDALLREIHHRVKNNLQIVHSLLNLQSEKVRDAETLETLKDCRDRVRVMAMIHERLYRSKDMGRIDFADYVQDLTKNLLRSHGGASGVRLSVDAQSLCLDIERAIPCGLVAYELASNALKHAFPDGRPGEIKIRLRREEKEEIVLEIADNGVGFPAHMAVDKAQSLGLRLVQTLVYQLGGRLVLENAGGARFTLVFPERAPAESVGAA